MNRKYVQVVAILLIAALVITSVSLIAFAGETSENSQEYLDERIDTLEQYIRFIQSKYTDEVTYEELLDAAFEGVNDALDPFSVYYPNQEEADAFTSSVAGQYTGIGIAFKTTAQGALVSSVMGGGPAAGAGIHEADVITHVDGKDIRGLESSAVQALLLGEENTSVTVTINRDGQGLSFTPVRKTIHVDHVGYTMLDNKIAYVRIAEFDNDAQEEFAAVAQQLLKEGATSVILDLRDNPGGYLNGAIEIADLILSSGDITHLQTQGNIFKTYSADATKSLALDMVVLVNDNTASASELLAAALQDNKAATVVGTKTYGKGVAQTLYNLKDGSAFKLSVFYFLTPDKQPINKVGITPDYVVASGGDEALLDAYNAFAPLSEKVKPALGSTGLNVYGVQQRLALLGYAVEITGTFDQGTLTALKAFQSENGLYPYGVADYTTMATLDKAAYSRATVGDADAQLKKAVELLQ